MARSTNEKVNDHLQAALESLERERGKLDEQIRSIRAMLGQGTAKVSAAEGSDAAEPVVRRRRKRRKLSAEARERIAAAQKKRWSEFRKKKKTAEAAA